MAANDERRIAGDISVVVVDDQPLVTRWAVDCLGTEPHLRVVGTAACGAEAVTLVTQQQPDVLLLDLHLPDMSGLAVAREIRDRVPHVAVLVFSGFDVTPFEALVLGEAGVAGVVSKSLLTTSEPVAAVRLVAAGQTIFPSDVARAAAGGAPALTRRQREVLTRLATGDTNAEIGRALALSVHTVDAHLRRIYPRLGVANRAGAVAAALAHGLVEPPRPPSGHDAR